METKPINFLLPHELYDRCKAAAEADGRKVSGWIRWILIRELKRLEAERGREQDTDHNCG